MKNLTVNMPVKVSNLICTLSFRTPSGTFLPVSTFKFRNEDYSEFVQEVYGGEELGPYTIEVKNLNTREVKLALANGYMPQIHVVSYDMTPVRNSNYNPGVQNLKIVEEVAKGRTALIKIIGSNAREIHRVAAFDVTENAGTSTGVISPGISLKKALFLALKDNIGDGESWTTDSSKDKNPLTISDNGLKWKAGVTDKDNYIFGSNKIGNSWRNFETYVKSYEKNGEIHRIETIKRIGLLSKYNPFSKDDNTGYNPNELLSKDELLKMKFWVIFHNGRYFEGDLNDPIWAGDRYEIVCMDMFDFNEHVASYVYAPFQSGNRFYMDTRWNAVSEEEGEFARAVYLGKVLKGDVVQLELNLLESRFLFQNGQSEHGFGTPVSGGTGSIYYNYNYTFEPVTDVYNGIPDKFTYTASGGVNSIFVNINQTKNANSYRIKFTEMYPPTGQTAYTKSVSILREDIETNSLVCINSKTLDIIGTEVGYISGTPDTTNDGETETYKVEVFALGTLNGINVSTRGESTSNLAYVVEPNPDVADNNILEKLPKAFSFSASGTTDAIDVRIQASQDAEYYLIKCKGPFNYFDAANVPSVDIIGNAGYNSISLDKYSSLRPSFEAMEEKNFQTGVYTVEVYAVNRFNADTAGTCDEYNTPGNCVIASNDKVFAEVGFDRYAKQRKLEPRISKELYDMSAVDLEVNFNDGSGWFKLQLVDPYEYEWQDDDQSHVIDCYSSSYMELDTQKFVINFEAPKGDYGLPNIFFGQRPETKVYLRTIPKQKYRDTFWPVIDINDLTGDPVSIEPYMDETTGDPVPFEEYIGDNLYLDFNITSWADDFDITDLWTSSNNTDASMLEDVAKISYVTGFSDALKQCYLSKSTGTQSAELYDDFFFSPKEHKVFVVKASIDMEGYVQTPYRPNPPAFTTYPPFNEECNQGNNYCGYTWDYIQLKNITAATATGYTVYWTECPDGTCPENFASVINWIDSKPATLDPSTGKFQKMITGLTSGKSYMIAVTATNRYGTSDPAVVKNINVPLKPAGTPWLPSYTGGAMYSDEDGIHCSGLVSQYAAVFAGKWKLESEDDLPVNWKSFDILESTENPGTWGFLIPQAIIEAKLSQEGNFFTEAGIERRNKVILRIQGINSDGLSGEVLRLTVQPLYMEMVTCGQLFNNNYNELTAWAKFPHTLTKKYGFPIEGDDFTYGYSLNDTACNIYDTEDSGPLAEGKIMRIIMNDYNVTDIDHWGLSPVAQNFSNGLISPTGKQVCIDPLRSEFVLPRPCYMRLDATQVTNPIIGSIASYTGSWGVLDTGIGNIFNNIIYIHANGAGTYALTIVHRNTWPAKGTLSGWLMAGTGGNVYNSRGYMGYGNGSVICAIADTNGCSYRYAKILVYFNGSVVYTSSQLHRSTNYHVYIIWDSSGTDIGAGRTWQVFINGVSVAYGSGNITGLLSQPLYEFGYATASGDCNGFGASEAFKYWDSVVSPTPTWIYNFESNGGNTYRYALHPIYGAENYYRPNFSKACVSYYYNGENE